MRTRAAYIGDGNPEHPGTVSGTNRKEAKQKFKFGSMRWFCLSTFCGTSDELYIG